MRESLKDYEHLLRAVLLLVAGLFVFTVFAGVMTPKGFGAYGHFRAGALDDNASRPLSYAGHAACEECHDAVVAARKGSKHARINCETCHGPLARHAEDPTSVKPERPDGRALCLKCHARSASRPAAFPQVVAAEHAGDAACTSCHRHHHPEPEA